MSIASSTMSISTIRSGHLMEPTDQILPIASISLGMSDEVHVDPAVLAGEGLEWDYFHAKNANQSP